jgi:hypothetical protein
MKWTSLVTAALLVAPIAARAASLAIYPPDPTNQDPLVLEVLAAPPCATVAFDAVRLLEGGVIQVQFDDGNRVLCTSPTFCPLRVPLGRLPPGQYTVEFVPNRVSLVSGAAMQVTVFAAALPYAPPVYDSPRRRRGQRGDPIGCTT